MANSQLWLRWSWRDLRSRWVQVVAIALIIALGTGVFAGLGGQKTWRIASYDLSYGKLHMYDIKMELADGSYANGDDLLAALRDVPGLTAIDTRLIVPTLVDASHDGEPLLVRGRIVGVDVRDDGPSVNQIAVASGEGRNLTAADSGQNVAVVEYKFAKHYDLKPGAPLQISGGVALDFVGRGQSPEYFLIMPESGNYFGESDFAVLFVPLETVQKLTDRAGLVNDVVMTIDPAADRDAIRAALESRMASAFPNTGVTFTYKEDDQVYTGLYSDADGDQWMWNIMGMLFLLGAAMGAFNLVGRMVESQRREIGVGMALGLPRRWIAFRPMLVGLQIAILGTLFGLLVGLLLNKLFAVALKELVPLPYWDIQFYVPGYVRAILLGVTLPFLATLLPVWRAVRVAPVDAIRSGYLVAKGDRLTRLANRIPLPGRSFTQMPLRNVMRSPWRTLLTVLGIAIAIMLMTFMVGAMDSYVGTMQRADDAYRYEGRDRVLVDLDRFYPMSNGDVTALTSLTGSDGQPLFSASEAALLLGGSISNGADKIDTALELHDMTSALWVPKLVKGHLTASTGPGLIISQKAADDLGVTVGDTLTLEHPSRESLLSFRLVKTELPVIGIHDNPLRPLTYMDLSAASLMGLDGVTNLMIFDPAPGRQVDEIKASLLTQPGVTSVKSIADFSNAVKALLDMMTGILAIIEAVAVALAFLIAFNSTSISVDERVREVATMFAFGLRTRTVTRMQMTENVVIGALGTLIGMVSGWGLLEILFIARANVEMADLKLIMMISPESLLLAAGLGVVVVGLTPLLSIRRMRRMDIPSTLRVME
jgi:putative ABC transport system permease protein